MPGGEEAQVAPTEDPVPYVTLRIPATVAMSGGWFEFWQANASTVELSLPVDLPQKAGRRSELCYDKERARSTAKTLIGILDDGCPFAHDRLLSPGLKTRVLAIWDQERGRDPIPLGGSKVFGRRPVDFDYGLEFWRSGSTGVMQPPAQEIGMDDWIAVHTTPAGSVDEDGCYDRAGFVSLRRRATHGAHVADVLAGWVPTSARVSMDRTTPPSFQRDPAADWADQDIVFVQIPQDGVNDASGQWLRKQVIDGLRYVLSCATASTERVIFNISYGRTTGPHDGTATIEEFLSAMATVYDGTNGRPRLDVVLAAGNSRRSACHVTFKSTQVRTTRWTWRVPADNTVPVMAEVRVRSNEAADVSALRLDPPSPYVGRQAQLVGYQGTHDKRWLMVIPPTRGEPDNPGTTAPQDGPALHGDWTITVECARPGVEVHAYLARTEPNMGAKPGAKQSRFVDPDWEHAQGAAAGQSPGGAAAANGSLVSTAGTLSGIATACTPHVRVAGGYCIATQRPSDYSSAGPSRGQRAGPDCALPTDETIALPGIPGAGSRSGCVFRLVGTSTAAPQLARLLARGAPPKPCCTGGPQGGPTHPHHGCGLLPPP